MSREAKAGTVSPAPGICAARTAASSAKTWALTASEISCRNTASTPLSPTGKSETDKDVPSFRFQLRSKKPLASTGPNQRSLSWERRTA